MGRRDRGVQALTEPLYDLVEEEGTLAPLFGGTVTKEHLEHVLAC